ncbi:3-hydroxyacyl-CoA dehydrogenase family protein [Micromonospora craniellae]|uniref:3-hydroxyacyl-CoA dehydrogenase family protein n=1 Tax=Micromonospora craniellae TaxID=2294034 RepID=A0A372G539_9ACTN|nr:3-hydroxybutyryl-CoA dehydrogenase [Micromonospora craniellae]QOC90594.1 3-hydroxyacyl-CoA dehydrogenase family protein [Micromonospora craniellae]RFS48024.1 3-hydroxyacyl-CoA dehydrogenase family protein [Micromonospora craniellae]
MAREFTSVGVVGLGTMGAGIVEVFARSGVDVVAVEITDTALERGRATLSGSTDRAVAKGRLAAADRDALLGRVTFAVGLDALHAVDLVIEAVPERLDLKRRLFADLDRICKPEAVLATNTSSLSVTEIAVATGRPDQVIGIHFFNPAPVMKLVEVVRTVVTADDVVADVEALCARLGKVGVTIGDRAGFVANALLFGYLNHAVAMVEARYATREDIDVAMKLGCGLPMGPLALMDLIGLDTSYEVLDTMYRRGGRDRRHAPAPLLRQMVTAGLLGRKSGRGFYTYERPGSSKVVPDAQTPAPAPETPTDPVRAVGVAGAGASAHRLVAVFAAAGYQVAAVGPEFEDPATAGAAVRTALAENVGQDRLGEADRDAALARITWSTASAALADADLLVEAVADDLDVKKALLTELDAVCKPGAVLATTTSALPVIELAMATGRPADVVGLHFVHPGAAAPLVEIVRTIRTSDQAVDTARAVCATLGRTGVVCDDRAGFLVNALLFPYLNDAVRMLEAGYAGTDDVDHAMTLGCGYPTGPFALLDAVGLDVALAIQRRLYRELRDPGFAPAPLLEQLVTAGHLGHRTGRGFRDLPG